MENKRPANWWNSTPKIVNGKVLCVAILPDGEETTNLFTLEELSRLLTHRALDGATYERDGLLFCKTCGSGMGAVEDEPPSQ